jgi:osmotically-inducible protein OsmY
MNSLLSKVKGMGYRMLLSIIPYALYPLPLLLLTACVPPLIHTVAPQTQAQGVADNAVDARIRSDLNELLLKDLTIYDAIEVKIFDRRVLMMGYLGNEQIRARAIALAWKVGGVREVINEIRIGTKGSAAQANMDRWLETKLDTNLSLASGVHNLNYSTNVVKNIAYIIGIAHSEAERQKVEREAAA